MNPCHPFSQRVHGDTGHGERISGDSGVALRDLGARRKEGSILPKGSERTFLRGDE